MMNFVSGGEQEREFPEVASGIWKFGEKVTPEQLVELAKKWAKADTNNTNKRYIDLHVRKCSKNQHGIGFKYILCFDKDDSNQEDYKEFFNQMTDKLKKGFGNDFAGWDVSSFTHIII